ncbi:MAG: alpha/beta hydrolase [Chloroflexi bacterium]|nr:alpha/beta hydrolase [Chloroflexota bacterium]
MSYQFANVNGTKIHYQEVGGGQNLVLLHAGVAHMGMWEPQMATLTQQFRVLRYDVRGWGQTASPPGTFYDHEDLAALLDHVGMETAVFVGCSWGGKIAIDFALHYPKRVQALILVGSGVGGYEFTITDPIQQIYDQMEKAFEQEEVQHASSLFARIWADGLSRTSTQVNPQFRQQAVQLMVDLFSTPEGEGERKELDPPGKERLQEIQTPTLVIIGEHDTDDVKNIANLLSTQIPDAKRIDMANTAHLPNMEHAGQFDEIVVDFIKTRI